MFPEGSAKRASKGHLYPVGGFFILDIVNPDNIHSYRFEPLKGVTS